MAAPYVVPDLRNSTALFIPLTELRVQFAALPEPPKFTQVAIPITCPARVPHIIDA
jgi:hypothetical protein